MAAVNTRILDFTAVDDQVVNDLETYGYTDDDVTITDTGYEVVDEKQGFKRLVVKIDGNTTIIKYYKGRNHIHMLITDVHWPNGHTKSYTILTYYKPIGSGETRTTLHLSRKDIKTYFETNELQSRYIETYKWGGRGKIEFDDKYDINGVNLDGCNYSERTLDATCERQDVSVATITSNGYITSISGKKIADTTTTRYKNGRRNRVDMISYDNGSISRHIVEVYYMTGAIKKRSRVMYKNGNVVYAEYLCNNLTSNLKSRVMQEWVNGVVVKEVIEN